MGLGPDDVPSKGGNTLDTLSFRLMMQNQYTNISGVESLWDSHTVGGAGSTQAAVRWYQLPVTGGTVGSALQASTWNPDTTNRFMPSLAVDRAGDMAIGYSASNTPLCPACATPATGRRCRQHVLADRNVDVHGWRQPARQLRRRACHRWGDYSAMTLDPDGCTFWYTNEYYAANGLDHHTRIGKFIYSGCTPLPGHPDAHSDAQRHSDGYGQPHPDSIADAHGQPDHRRSTSASPSPTPTPTPTPTPLRQLTDRHHQQRPTAAGHHTANRRGAGNGRRANVAAAKRPLPRCRCW